MFLGSLCAAEWVSSRAAIKGVLLLPAYNASNLVISNEIRALSNQTKNPFCCSAAAFVL